jgi:hypothetical protein
VDEAVKIAKETAERIDKIMKTDDLEVSIERKKLFVLGEIAVLLAGMLDVKFTELGVEVEDDET